MQLLMVNMKHYYFVFVKQDSDEKVTNLILEGCRWKLHAHPSLATAYMPWSKELNSSCACGTAQGKQNCDYTWELLEVPVWV